MSLTDSELKSIRRNICRNIRWSGCNYFLKNDVSSIPDYEQIFDESFQLKLLEGNYGGGKLIQYFSDIATDKAKFVAIKKCASSIQYFMESATDKMKLAAIQKKWKSN